MYVCTAHAHCTLCPGLGGKEERPRTRLAYGAFPPPMSRLCRRLPTLCGRLCGLPPQEPPRCVSALALKHEGGDSREDGIDAEVLSIVPSADGTALFCGLARWPGWKSGRPAAARVASAGWLETRACRPRRRAGWVGRRPRMSLTSHSYPSLAPGRWVHRSLGRRPRVGRGQEGQSFAWRGVTTFTNYPIHYN